MADDRPEKTSGSLDLPGQLPSPGEKRVIIYPVPYKCDFCSFTSTTWLSTELHLKSVHSCRLFSFTCSKCTKEWTSINSVASHYARCKGGIAPANIPPSSASTYACSSCGACFDTNSGLQLHRKRAHPDAFLQTCVQKTKARWSVDEINLLAKVEANLHPACKNINQVLEQKLIEFHIARNVEMIKGQRRKAAYKELVLQYRRGQQQEVIVGSPSGVVGFSPQVISTSAHNTDALSNDLIREAYSLPEVDIDDLQTKLLQNLAPSRGPTTRGVRKHDSRPKTETARTNVRVARFKRFQRLFQNNRGKLASHILDGASLDQFNGNIDEATALLVKTLSSRPILPANEEAESSDSPCVSVTQPITAVEVARELKAARPTAVGPDGLKLQKLRELNAFDIASLFNLWLKAGKLPVSVKASRTIFIPKIDGTSDISKCRPITIASMLYRLFSRIITKGLATAVHLSERQKAFLPDVNGVFENTSSLYAFIKDAKARSKEIYIAMLDLAKAFDSVPHERIIRALRRKNVHPASIDLIANMLTGTTYAEIKGLKGNTVQICNGVRQGDPLSPLLFCLFLDEMIVRLQESGPAFDFKGRKISALAFADDMTLLADSAAGLKILLKVASDFLAESGMMLNADKCLTLSICRSPKTKKMFSNPVITFSVADSRTGQTDRMEKDASC
ncbi:Retrovirus-related Pol polyprotein from type-1 retrotransposable element [Trichinella zimbabwensis]|uniref:Retrovirus-related Pol polyprotein from type-1 retrotransposable element n=1 Tax=Trichinella zimbabwensis TaxID=268475 RepID=A0A0V1GU64_9BILA|nr:Retrovirus-related Pol polyprotein from type-1 retrotransposable element [Trichinella zimbabwensis]